MLYSMYLYSTCPAVCALPSPPRCTAGGAGAHGHTASPIRRYCTLKRACQAAPPIIALPMHKRPRDAALGTGGMLCQRTISRTTSQHALARAPRPRPRRPRSPSVHGPLRPRHPSPAPTQGLAHRSHTRSLRSDPRHYWTISARLARHFSSCLRRARVRSSTR